jgi:hypothetical protein
MSGELIEEESSVLLQLLSISECFVYKVPPLRTASGHRAEDWDLANPVFTGCLKVHQVGMKLIITVYSFINAEAQSSILTTVDNITLFGECPIEVKPGESVIQFVDGVIDSSRYICCLYTISLLACSIPVLALHSVALPPSLLNFFSCFIG